MTVSFACDDLVEYGVVLIPPSRAEYFELLADIEHRLQKRPKGSPPVSDESLSFISEHDTSASAILVNRANIAIASLAYIWSLRGRNDRIVTNSSLPGTNPSVLLPFGLNDRSKKFDFYWNTIFPGSKRLITCGGPSFGDNSDVRPPAADELSQGGFVTWGGGRPEPSEPVRLALDGVFFEDGGFAGPNRLGAWEHTVFCAEAHLACAELARKAASAREFFLDVQHLTDQPENGRLPPPPPPGAWRNSQLPDPQPIRKREFQMVGWQVFRSRQRLGDEATINSIKAWADAPVPKFHKL